MARAGAKQPTLRDVAALGGVSHQTVSRVITDRTDVMPETRARVEQAIQQLSYHPLAIARSMARGRSSTLGRLAANLTDFAYAPIMEGAQAVAHQHGYYLLCAAYADGAQVDALIEQLLGYRRVAGVSVIGPYLDNRRIPFPSNVPGVLMGGCERDGVRHLVYLDNYNAAIEAAEHLLALRHRCLAQITGPMAEDSSQERDRGFRKALTAAGIEPDPRLTVEGNWSATSGYQLLELLVAREPGITGIVSQNDRMAVGAIRAARDLGWRVPFDLSVVGFDDMPLASYFDPPLTTMRQDTFAVGRACAGLLMDILDKPDAGVQHIRLAAELVVRQSSAPARRKEVRPPAIDTLEVQRLRL